MGLRRTTLLKHALLACLSRVSRRHAVLLPSQARDEDSILDLRAPYRIEGPVCRVELLEPGPAQFTATLLGYSGHFPVRTIWTGAERTYAGPCALELDLTTGAVKLGGEGWGHAPLPLPSRRFCWQLDRERQLVPPRAPPPPGPWGLVRGQQGELSDRS